MLAEIGTLIDNATDDELAEVVRQVTLTQTRRHIEAIARLIESDKVKAEGLGYVHGMLADMRRQLESPPAKDYSPGRGGGFSPQGESIPF